MTKQTVYADGKFSTVKADEVRIYKRPKKAKGDRSKTTYKFRARFSSELKELGLNCLPSMPIIAVDEAISAARAQGRPAAYTAWTQVQIRRDHLAMVEIMQAAHLKNTGSEISRSEAMAAMMLHGLAKARNLPEFQTEKLDL